MTNIRDLQDMIVLPCIGPVEDRAIKEVHRRLAMGAKQYGLFNEDDGRDLDAETRDEMVDAIVYQALRLFQRKQGGGK